MDIREIGAKISQISGIPVRVDNLSGGTTSSATLPPLPSQSGGVLNPLMGGSSRDSYASRGIPLDWHGSIAGLLDYITAKDGVWWRYRHGAIHIFRTETETFSIPALNWSTDASGTIEASTGANSSGSGSGGGIGGVGTGTMSTGIGGTSGTGGSNVSTGATSIINTSKTNVWKSLQKTAETVAGPGAQVMADASMGTITVTGTPREVGQVRQWVRQLTRQLSRQVAITIHVYNVQVNNEQNYGLNLSGAFQNLGKQYGVTLQSVAPPSPSGNVAPMSLGANILSSATGALGQFNGSSVAVQALATLGHVTQVFSRSAVTQNGQPAPIQVAQQTTYLAESSSTQTANVGSTTGLIPGTVTTGFTALFLPRIDDGYIYLGMNMTISNLVGIQTISNSGGSIQAPTVDSSTFQQMAKLKPGQTLLLTGYSQAGGNTTRNGVGSPYFPLLGGGADASTQKTMIAIVITARIL
jgi:type IVB pilus formation R64 PilN family outer membrane protein